MIDFEEHAAIEGYEIREGELFIAGKAITQLVGPSNTPAYVYASELIDQRVRALRKVLPAQVDLHYAVKANPHPEIVRQLGSLVDGLDVASGRELEVALKTDIDPLEISFAGPGKQDWELELALQSGIVTIVESPSELIRLQAIADSLGVKAQIALRVNPDFELKGSGMRMSGGAKPFGSDVDLIPQMLASIEESSSTFVGFHIFSGSQCLDADAICDAQSKALALSLSLGEALSSPPRFINIGGGFGVPYAPGQSRLAPEGIGEHMSGLVAQLAARWPSCKLVIELGRYLVAEAGVYVTKVIDTKTSHGEKFAVTDGGMHHHLALSGNFGQVFRRNYPICLAASKSSAPLETATIVGPLCTPLDILGSKMMLPEISVGDMIVVFLSGAYGYTASPLKFLSHAEPSEIVI